MLFHGSITSIQSCLMFICDSILGFSLFFVVLLFVCFILRLNSIMLSTLMVMMGVLSYLASSCIQGYKKAVGLIHLSSDVEDCAIFMYYLNLVKQLKNVLVVSLISSAVLISVRLYHFIFYGR